MLAAASVNDFTGTAAGAKRALETLTRDRPADRRASERRSGAELRAEQHHVQRSEVDGPDGGHAGRAAGPLSRRAAGRHGGLAVARRSYCPNDRRHASRGLACSLRTPSRTSRPGSGTTGAPRHGRSNCRRPATGSCGSLWPAEAGVRRGRAPRLSRNGSRPASAAVSRSWHRLPATCETSSSRGRAASSRLLRRTPGPSMSRRSGASRGRTAPSRRSTRQRSRSAFAVPSMTADGPTSWPRGAIPRRGTCCSSAFASAAPGWSAPPRRSR